MSEQRQISHSEALASGGPALETDTDGQNDTATQQRLSRALAAPAADTQGVYQQSEDIHRSATASPVQAHRGFPVHAGQVQRRTPSETQASMVREPLQSTLAREADPANRLFPNIDQRCAQAGRHIMGVFCHHCRGIPMPWGADLPHVTDDSGADILRGPSGSLLEGVRLRNSNAIATLSTLAYLSLTNQPHISVDGFNAFEARYVASAAAGRQVVRLVNSTRSRATHGERIPHFYDIIHRALLEPDLSYETHRNNILRTFGRENQRRHGDDNVSRRLSGVVLGGMTARATQDSESVLSRDAESGSANSGRLGSTPTDEDFPEELIFEERPNVQGTRANRPAPSGDWEFVPGTNLEPAALGEPDPSKFFLVRQKASNPAEKDCRQYPGWADFDWNNQSHIDGLNRSRRQIRSRTIGNIAEPRLPWTQMEKDVLKSLVQNALARGMNRKTIDWDNIAQNMSKYFEGVVQEIGQPLAQCTKVVDGIEQQPRHTVALTLKSERRGAQNRGGNALKNQAEKYGDIWLLLEASKPRGKRVRRKEKSLSIKSEPQSPEPEKTLDSDSEVGQRQKRPKLGPRDIAPRGPKKPPGNPPPGGAGGLVGRVEKRLGLAATRTSFPSR